MIRKVIKKGLKVGFKVGSITKRKAKKVVKMALKGKKIKRKDLEKLAKNVMSESLKEQRRMMSVIQKEITTSINRILSVAEKSTKAIKTIKKKKRK